jgi:hypothetical protein
MSPTARRAAPLARPPRRRSHLAWGFSAGCYAERAEQVTVQPVALLRGPVLAPAPAVAHAASSLPHGIFFRPPLGGRYGVNTRLDSLPQALRHVHVPNRTQRRPPCPTATTPLAPRLGVCSDQQEDNERLQPQPALFQVQVRPQQGAEKWDICGELCCPAAGSFHRLTSTGPRTHPRLWPSPRPSTSASEAARRLPLLSRGATGLRVEIHIELPTSRRAPLESETDHSCSQRRRAGCSRACGRRGAAALGASRTGRGEARSGLARIPCTCGSYSAARRLPPARGLHVRGHIGGGYPSGVGTSGACCAAMP